jgi:hypothetical protein
MLVDAAMPAPCALARRCAPPCISPRRRGQRQVRPASRRQQPSARPSRHVPHVGTFSVLHTAASPSARSFRSRLVDLFIMLDAAQPARSSRSMLGPSTRSFRPCRPTRQPLQCARSAQSLDGQATLWLRLAEPSANVFSMRRAQWRKPRNDTRCPTRGRQPHGVVHSGAPNRGNAAQMHARDGLAASVASRVNHQGREGERQRRGGGAQTRRQRAQRRRRAAKKLHPRISLRHPLAARTPLCTARLQIACGTHRRTTASQRPPVAVVPWRGNTRRRTTSSENRHRGFCRRAAPRRRSHRYPGSKGREPLWAPCSPLGGGRRRPHG